MGKFNELLKVLGVAAKDVGNDAVKALSKVDNPELAVSLKGKAREQYLNALDEVYGPQSNRIKDMGFNSSTYYHETKPENVESIFSKGFDINKSNAAKGDYITPYGVFVKETPKNIGLGGEKAEQIPLKIKNNLQDLFHNRDELKSYEKMKIPEFNNLINQIDKNDLRYQKQFDDVWKNVPYTERKKDNLLENIIAEWENANDPIYKNLKEKATEHFNKQNSNAIKLMEDKGSFGRSTDSTIVLDPKNIRSENAAFDPRFKDSPLLMAGGAAVPMVDMNPLNDIKKGLGYYEKAKEVVTKPLAQQLNIANNPEDEKTYNEILKTGLDPVNYIPGAAGVGLGAIQMLTPSEDEIKKNALKKLGGF